MSIYTSPSAVNCFAIVIIHQIVLTKTSDVGFSLSFLSDHIRRILDIILLGNKLAIPLSAINRIVTSLVSYFQYTLGVVN